MPSPEYRSNAYRLLKGTGLEIGALHQPAPVPAAAVVHYFDAVPETEAARLFPELDPRQIVHVDYFGDLDRDGLAQFAGGTFDFVIINHVLEHLSNPVKAVREVFRIIRPGGCAVIAIPDKRYTYDRLRAETSFEHLWDDYLNATQENSDEHYLDFLRSAGAHVFAEPASSLPHHIKRCRERREHAHVWTSASFRDFLGRAFPPLSIQATCLYEAAGEETQMEYFSLWQKLG